MKKLLLSTVLLGITLLGCKTKKAIIGSTTNNINQEISSSKEDIFKPFSKEEIIEKSNQYVLENESKKYKDFKIINTQIIDTINLLNACKEDTFNLNRVLYMNRIYPTLKILSEKNRKGYDIQKRISDEILDKEVINFYDTTSKNFLKINLSDSSVKYNKHIFNSKNTNMNFYLINKVFTYNNNKEAVKDTIIGLFSDENVRLVAFSHNYKKGFQVVGTTQKYRNVFNEEYEKFINENKDKKFLKPKTD